MRQLLAGAGTAGILIATTAQSGGAGQEFQRTMLCREADVEIP
jgi:hypothetical protein